MMLRLWGLFSVIIGLGWACVPAGVAAQDKAKLIEPDANTAWHIAPDGTNAVLLDAKNGVSILKFTKAQLGTRPNRLALETDAKKALIVCGTVEIPVALKADGGAVQVDFSTAPTDPWIKVDGKADARSQPNWIAICKRADAPNFELKLFNATFATATFSDPAAEKNADAPLPVMPQPQGQPPRAAPRARNAQNESALDRAKHCVFQVRVKNKAGQAIGDGSGFLVKAGGYGITNYHVVSGGSSAVAVFAGEKEEHKLELWAASKELDLALVKFTDANDALDARGVIEIAAAPPTEGQEVWALGFPLGLGYSVTRGVVNGVRTPDQLPAEIKKMRPNVKSWIQTDCTINGGNSGGPLIDSNGSLIGVNTWVLLVGQNLYFAVAASELKPMFSAILKQPVGFASVASDDKEGDAMRLMAAELPNIEISQTGTPEQLRGAVAGLSSTLKRKCDSCVGDGAVNIRVTTGRTRTGRPIYQEGRRACLVCKGAGVRPAQPEAASKIAARLCSSVATLKPTAPKADDALGTAYTAIAEVLGSSSDTANALNQQLRARVAQRNLKKQEPIVGVGVYVGSIVIEGGKQKLHVLQLTGSTQCVIANVPRLSDQPDVTPVLVGGLYAGEIPSRTGANILVLQGGFVVKAKGMEFVRK